MDPVRSAKLSEGQRACLRMVLRHMSSKEIARELGISSHTVDQRLRVAMQILGASSRVEAARTFEAVEGTAAYQPFVYQPQQLDVQRPERAPHLTTSEGRWQEDERPVEALREEQASFEVLPPIYRPALRLPLPMWGVRPNDLGIWARLGWILAILIGSIITLGVLVDAAETLSRLVRS